MKTPPIHVRFLNPAWLQKGLVSLSFVFLFLITGCGDSSSVDEYAPNRKEEVHPLGKFTGALESAGLTLTRTETPASQFPESSGIRYLLFLDGASEEEWLEVYAFDTIEEARSVFPEEGVEIQGEHQNIERNGNLVLFTYDTHTHWDRVYPIWAGL